MDIGHYFSGDLQSSATGDLLLVDSVLESKQRVLRRLLTNPLGYIWQPKYGAGLPAQIGNPINQPQLAALTTAQMFLEPSVVQNPRPHVNTVPISNGINVKIQYVEADSAAPATLNFDATP
jgi:hypothetical protein